MNEYKIYIILNSPYDFVKLNDGYEDRTITHSVNNTSLVDQYIIDIIEMTHNVTHSIDEIHSINSRFIQNDIGQLHLLLYIILKDREVEYV